MKKLGKKLSFLTKIMLVIGLLISNLSSLSVVFAYEATGAVQISVVNDKLNIKYTDELAEEVENVNVKVYENYTYLDNSPYYVDEVAAENGKAGKESNYSLTSEQLLALEGYEAESILSVIKFDGLYEVKVEITDVNNEVIDSAIYSENIEHESGLSFKLFDEMDNEIVPVDGVYPLGLENSKVKVVAQVLSGGLSPMDMFMYDEVSYTATELLEYSFSDEMDLSGRLFGEYTLPFEVKLLDVNSEEVVYAEELKLMYESYEMNASVLNTATEELEIEDTYEFVSETKDGILYVLLNSNRIHTMLDLYNIVNLANGESEIISYVLSNSEYEDVLASYDEETAEVTLEEYLESIVLDDSVMLTLTNAGLTVTYKVVVTADMNGDNALTEDDLSGLINQVVGEDEVNTEKADLNKDTKVDTLDVMYLNEVIKTGAWEVELTDTDASLESSLVVDADDIVSGDEFTVSYKVTLTEYSVNGVAGLFKYDETMLELVKVETATEWLGNAKDGKFLYLGEESLTGVVTLDETTGEEIVESKEYVLVTATFKALKSGESVISLENPEYFDGTNYLLVEQEDITTNVVVNASDNNSLASLFVAGQEIVLTKDENGEDVLEYEITVSNDVTMADVEAIVENVAANITSIVYPEELAEGENTVTITVTSESGDVKVYTVIVNREAAPEEETVTAPVNNNYYNDYDDEDEDEDVVVPKPEVDEDDEDETPEKEESNLSRIVIIILILLVIAGLVYLIFKDDEDEETKKANKAVNRLRKEEVDAKVEKTVEAKPENKPVNKSNNKPNNKHTNNKNKASNNKKRER